MAQTAEDILRNILGQQLLQIALLTAQVQMLQEQLAQIQAQPTRPPA